MTTLALIGLGSMGKKYLEIIPKVPNAQIKYICSKTYSTLTNFPDNYIKLSDYKKLINFPIHGVIIATSDQTHFEIASYFISKKIPVLIEKPLTLKYKHSEKLIRLQKRNKIKVLVGHTLLYNPAYQKIKEILHKIGEIKYLQFDGGNKNPRLNTSVLYDWGPHGISLFLDLLQKNPITLKVDCFSRSHNGTLDEILVEMEFDKNIKANLNLSWKSAKKRRKLIITGTEGGIIFDDMLDKKVLLKKDAKKTYLKYSTNDPLVIEVSEFVKSISQDGSIYSNLEKGVNVIKVLNDIEKLVKLKKTYS